MDIHHNLELLKAVAMQKAKDHGCNYNIVLMNANSKGEFDADYGSAYEFVADSHLQKDATNVILLHKTDDLISAEMSNKIGKKIDKLGIVGAGNFARTIMHGDTAGPVVIVDSKEDALGVDPFGTSTPIFNPYNNNPEILNIDHDVFPVKRKGKTNYTAPKKKRKK